MSENTGAISPGSEKTLMVMGTALFVASFGFGLSPMFGAPHLLPSGMAAGGMLYGMVLYMAGIVHFEYRNFRTILKEK